MSKRLVGATAFLGILLFATAGRVNAHDLLMETVNAWDAYIQGAHLRTEERLNGRKPFLWIDESAERRQRIRVGEILVAPVIGYGIQSVPNGLVHHWIGGIFIPNATIDSLAAITLDYGRYKEFYSPVVVEAKLLACTATGQRFSMLWHRKVLFVDAAMQGEYAAHEVRIDSHRGYNVSDTVQLQEIENYGRPNQRVLPPDTGDGFIWRLHSVARYEERDGGVYLELEAIVLTREIPSSVRWLVSPVVNRLSRNSLTTSLRQTRDAVNSMSPYEHSVANRKSSGQRQCAVPSNSSR
jgi:hypothetical protein